MSDPDDEALRWAGDDREPPVRPSARPAGEATAPEAGRPAELLVLGVLGGVALLETVFWVRGVLEPAIAVTVGTGGGSVAEVLAFAANLAGRVLAVAAPVVWFAGVLLRVRPGGRRVAWLALGAVLLVPWPAVLAAT